MEARRMKNRNHKKEIIERKEKKAKGRGGRSGRWKRGKRKEGERKNENK